VITRKRKRTTNFGSKKISYLDILIVVVIIIVTISVLMNYLN